MPRCASIERQARPHPPHGRAKTAVHVPKVNATVADADAVVMADVMATPLAVTLRGAMALAAARLVGLAAAAAVLGVFRKRAPASNSPCRS